MHQEVSRREKVSAIWMSITILTAALVFMVVNIILVKFQWNSGVTDLIIIGLCAFGVYYFIRQNIISYKYCIIDQELIVHEVMGSKEKMILNLNMSQIVAFDYTDKEEFAKDKQSEFESKKRLYNCTNKQNRCYIIYEEDGKRHLFTFHPSDYMIELITEKL